MKFVKGDAICGIVIIVINLLGGLGVGVMQQGMTLGAAMLKYSLLTIGDGMVAQIPALLSAMAAGLIVTRATSDDRDRHLGDAIARQLGAKPRVLVVAGGLCLLLALVPGFPCVVFGTMGLLIGVTGLLLLPPVKARWQRFTRPARETLLRRLDAAPAAAGHRAAAAAADAAAGAGAAARGVARATPRPAGVGAGRRARRAAPAAGPGAAAAARGG